MEMRLKRNFMLFGPGNQKYFLKPSLNRINKLVKNQIKQFVLKVNKTIKNMKKLS